MDKKISNVSKVVHTSDLKEVNELLVSGWIIIDTFTVTPYPGNQNDLELVYSMGFVG